MRRGGPERREEPHRIQTETDWRELQGDRGFLGGSGSRAWEAGKRRGGNGGTARPGTRFLVAGEKVRAVGPCGQKFGWDGRGGGSGNVARGRFGKISGDRQPSVDCGGRWVGEEARRAGTVPWGGRRKTAARQGGWERNKPRSGGRTRSDPFFPCGDRHPTEGRHSLRVVPLFPERKRSPVDGPREAGGGPSAGDWFAEREKGATATIPPRPLLRSGFPETPARLRRERITEMPQPGRILSQTHRTPANPPPQRKPCPPEQPWRITGIFGSMRDKPCKRCTHQSVGPRGDRGRRALKRSQGRQRGNS